MDKKQLTKHLIEQNGGDMFMTKSAVGRAIGKDRHDISGFLEGIEYVIFPGCKRKMYFAEDVAARILQCRYN